MEFEVLDKGYVSYVRHMGDDLAPVEDARMSTNNPTGVDVIKDDHLRNYLWENAHTSPSEGCVLTVELKLPLFVLRQIDRHRTLDINNMEISDYDSFRGYTSRNEFSGRYAEFPDEFYIPAPERLQKQSTKNKQGSEGDLNDQQKEIFIDNLRDFNAESFGCYKEFIKRGLSKEIARLLIPNNVYTKIRITSNLLNWFKFLKLRLDSHAQYEVKCYAECIACIIKKLWPKSWAVFEEHTLHGINLGRREIQALVDVLNNYDHWREALKEQGFSKLLNKLSDGNR